MNGVMIHDIPAHTLSWVDFARRHGIEMTKELFEQEYNGRINQEIFSGLFDKDISGDELQNYLREKELCYQEIYRPQFQPMAGLVELVAELHTHDIPVAIGTAGPPMNVTFTLELTGLKREDFDVIVDASQVQKGKPDPEIYNRVIEGLGVDAASCVVFEDSMNGINAAKAAGANPIGVATTHGPEYLKEAQVPIIKDFTEVSVEMLKDIIS